MRNPNGKILLIALVLVAVVAAAGLFFSRDLFAAPQQETSADGVQAYLRIQVGDQVGAPVPLNDGGEYIIDQPDGKQNVIRTTATGAVMHFSTCDNQSCVHQGEATLENRDSRVLGGLIICLPNEIVLEVLTPAEAGMEAAQ